MNTPRARALVIPVGPLREDAPEKGDAAETCAEEEGGYADGVLKRALTLVVGLTLLLLLLLLLLSLLFLRTNGLQRERVVAEGEGERMTRDGQHARAEARNMLTWRLIDEVWMEADCDVRVCAPLYITLGSPCSR